MQRGFETVERLSKWAAGAAGAPNHDFTAPERFSKCPDRSEEVPDVSGARLAVCALLSEVCLTHYHTRIK